MIKNESLKKYILPPVDMYETPDSYILFLDMPGVAKENLNIKVVGDSLVVRGKFDLPVSKGDEMLLNEIVKGEYMREFVLSGDVDRDKIGAKLTNGVLVLKLGKSDKSKEIEIKIEYKGGERYGTH